MDTSDKIQVAVAITQGLLALIAVIGLRISWNQTKGVRDEANASRLHDRDERTREWLLERLTRLMEAYEVLNDPDAHQRAQAKPTIVANLHALPIRELQTLRWEFDVYADGRLAAQQASYRERGTEKEKARQEMMGYFQRLTDRPDEDFEPKGSPTANRPFHRENEP